MEVRQTLSGVQVGKIEMLYKGQRYFIWKTIYFIVKYLHKDIVCMTVFTRLALPSIVIPYMSLSHVQYADLMKDGK